MEISNYKKPANYTGCLESSGGWYSLCCIMWSIPEWFSQNPKSCP